MLIQKSFIQSLSVFLIIALPQNFQCVKTGAFGAVYHGNRNVNGKERVADARNVMVSLYR